MCFVSFIRVLIIQYNYNYNSIRVLNNLLINSVKQ